MKRLGILAVALALGSMGCDDDTGGPTGPSLSGPIIFTSQLLASNEVPPVTNAESTGRGTVAITFNVPRDNAGIPVGPGTASFAIQAQGFAVNTPLAGAHIHPGAAGVNGPVLVNTGLSASPPLPTLFADGTINLLVTVNISQNDATQITANPGGYYFNIHTPLNPGGAIRGQLTRVQ